MLKADLFQLVYKQIMTLWLVNVCWGYVAFSCVDYRMAPWILSLTLLKVIKQQITLLFYIYNFRIIQSFCNFVDGIWHILKSANIIEFLFDKQSNLTEHAKKHHEQELLKCRKCEKGFSTELELKDHRTAMASQGSWWTAKS